MEKSLVEYITNLEMLLKKEAETLKEILNLEENKFDALKQIDIQKLMDINSEEETLLHILDTVEEKRKEMVMILSGILGFSPDISLTELLETLNDSEIIKLREEMKALKDEIKKYTSRLQIATRENSEIIGANLEIINSTISYATKAGIDDTYNYGKKKKDKQNINIINHIA